MTPALTPRDFLCPRHGESVTTTDGGIAHPGLTISVYRVNPSTLDRTKAVERVLPAAEEPVMSHAFPPCECPRCTGTSLR
jgi:hypothetical protein